METKINIQAIFYVATGHKGVKCYKLCKRTLNF